MGFFRKFLGTDSRSDSPGDRQEEPEPYLGISCPTEFDDNQVYHWVEVPGLRVKPRKIDLEKPVRRIQHLTNRGSRTHVIPRLLLTDSLTSQKRA